MAWITKRDGIFVFAVFCAALVWLPVATWIMPRIAGAPIWSENPAWYMSSLPMAVVIGILFRIARRLIDRVHRGSRSV